MAVPPPNPPSEQVLPAAKAALRRRLRAARLSFAESLGPTGMGEALAGIDRHLSPLLSRKGPIAGYVAMAGEVDVLPFLFRAFHEGHAIALPYVVRGRETMDFMRWHPEASMAPGMLGIPQVAGGEALEPAILLTPLLGFDRRGARLGQGGGFYDRWFAAHPQALRIGIAWSVQEVDALPLESWDMPLHAIATEKEWITP